MSHIIKQEQDIITVSKLLEKLRSKGYNANILEEILTIMIPKNSNLPIDVIIGNSKIPAFFSQKEQKIEVSLESLKNNINNLINVIIKKYPNLEQELFYNFVLLVMSHEVEHYYQCLIANRYIDFPYETVINGYKNLTFLNIPKRSLFITSAIKTIRFFYYYNGYSSLLERNANVEAYDLLLKVAEYENNIEILNILKPLYFYQLSIGYERSNNGCMEKTYKKKGVISIYNSFYDDEKIPIEDKVRYGLKIDDITKEKVLKKQFQI